MHANTGRRATTLWIVLLTAAAMSFTVLLRCLTPFPALAAVAATQMRRDDGLALVLAAWAVNQATGFCLLGYPHDPVTLAWGAGLGAAAVAAVLAAGWAADRHAGATARLAAAYATGFVAFKLVLVLCSLMLGDMATSLSLAIAAPQFVREAAIAGALLVLYRGLTRIGLPAARAPRAIRRDWRPTAHSPG